MGRTPHILAAVSGVIVWLMKNYKVSGQVNWIKVGLGIALVAAFTGCVGYVEGGYGGAVIVPEPDVYFYGGFHERGREVHEFSHRGFSSHSVAHPGIPHPSFPHSGRR